MHRFIKTFLLWLLLAALPLQGFAAAMRLPCGPTGHAVEPRAAAMHDHHDHAPADHASGQASASCSAGSACCVGAVALPVEPVVAPVYSAALPAVPVIPAPLADFIPGGLDRPPKTLTA
jgi:hypothetical protein